VKDQEARMRKILGLVLVGGLMLGEAAAAKAQGIAIGNPWTGRGITIGNPGVGFGYGVYNYPMNYGYGWNTTGYGWPNPYGSTWGYSSAYVAPGGGYPSVPVWGGYSYPAYGYRTTTYYAPGWLYGRPRLLGRWRW
jgi:hypothetical protein